MSADARAVASDQICAAALAYLASRLPPSATVALYAAKGSEVATEALDRELRAGGWSVAYPRVVPQSRTLAFHEAAIDELGVATFGLREPHVDAPAVPLAAISAFVIPGVGFDRGGGRIGWGRGYYDTTLADAPDALRIGLAFECQIVDEVMREPHDALVHVVVTERATHVVAA